MFGTPYFNQQYQQDLLNMRERIDKQLQQAQQPQNNQVPITQNFQLAPSQNQGGIKYASSIEDVKKELVFTDTLFINREHTLLWQKDASGSVKSYEVKEIIEMDDKDRQIAFLMDKINKLEMEMNNNERTSNVSTNVDEAIADKKPASISTNKSSKK